MLMVILLFICSCGTYTQPLPLAQQIDSDLKNYSRKVPGDWCYISATLACNRLKGAGHECRLIKVFYTEGHHGHHWVCLYRYNAGWYICGDSLMVDAKYQHIPNARISLGPYKDFLSVARVRHFGSLLEYWVDNGNGNLTKYDRNGKPFGTVIGSECHPLSQPGKGRIDPKTGKWLED
jgi:hypothetical protein